MEEINVSSILSLVGVPVDEIFGFMKDIWFTEYGSFKDAVDEKRNGMLSADESLLLDNGFYLDLDKAEEIPDGRFHTWQKGILFECVFAYKEERRLYVILNGALTTSPPQFSRWSYYPFLDGCMLNIADPMYRMYDGLKLGWYYGSPQYDLRVYMAEMVRKIAGIYGIREQDIIFLGSSGGGCAAVELAGLLIGARAVAINPQIILTEYDYGKKFTEITGNDLEGNDPWHRNDAIHWLNNNPESYHILLFNLRSAQDMAQVKNICKRLDISLKYGLNVFEHHMIWIYDAECEPFTSGHSAQEFYCIIFAVEFLLKNIGVGNLENQYASFFRLINEFWYFKWQQEQQLRMQILDPGKLVLCRETGKKAALWGSGEIAGKIADGMLDISGRNYYRIRTIFDNDERKTGTCFRGVEIIHPSRVRCWREYFVIVAVDRGRNDIFRQLESYGMGNQTDFIHWTDLLKK